jgi:hypothetical protein
MTSRVRTERTELSLTDFEKEIFELSPESECINMLLYGDSNAGKTVVAGTCPGRTFWLVGEPGYKTATRRGTTGHGAIISDTARAWAAVDWLEAKSRKANRPRYEQLDWIVLDGLSTIQNKFLLGYAAEAFDNNPAKRAHRNLPDKPDYFNTQNFLKSWIPRLVDMPVNLLITAHAFRTTSDDGELLVCPGIQGKGTEVANSISGLMDITAYMEAKRLRVRDTEETKLVRRMWFESPSRTNKREDDVRYICGEKFGVLGRFMDSPTIPRLLAKISGEE